MPVGCSFIVEGRSGKDQRWGAGGRELGEAEGPVSGDEAMDVQPEHHVRVDLCGLLLLQHRLQEVVHRHEQ